MITFITRTHTGVIRLTCVDLNKKCVIDTNKNWTTFQGILPLTIPRPLNNHGWTNFVKTKIWLVAVDYIGPDQATFQKKRINPVKRGLSLRLIDTIFRNNQVGRLLVSSSRELNIILTAIVKKLSAIILLNQQKKNIRVLISAVMFMQFLFFLVKILQGFFYRVSSW